MKLKPMLPFSGTETAPKNFCSVGGWMTVRSKWPSKTRKRNEVEKIALEDVEHMLLEVATNLQAAIEFDGAEVAATPT